MWTIRRIRLDRIGTPAARFLDVTLDLVSPATNRPVDTILWLRNGGGKSTIMALVGALLRPARDEFLSASDGARDAGRHLEDYVLGADTAHVVVEWGERDGRRLVTGAVYEWADRQPPADQTRDHDRLNAGYYLFRPLPDHLELEDLPYSADADRTTLDAFLSHLRRFAAATDVVVTRKQSEWTKALDARRIDSDLWRTILAMNRTEGGIEQQFLFSSADDFARYLLRLIVEPEEPDGVADLLRKVAAKLVRRPDLLEELRFVREAVERLEELDVAYRDDQDARSLLAIAQRQAIELRAALRAGEKAARNDADSAERERTDAVERRREHDREAEVARHTQSEYRRLAALRRTEAAAARADDVTRRLGSARALVEAWTVASQVAAYDSATERERMLAEELAAATADAEPERFAYLTEAGRLATVLVRHADAAEADSREATNAQRLAHQEIKRAAAELSAATRRRTTLEARLAELDRLHRTLAEDLARARREGVLGTDETGCAAVLRLRAADESAERDERATSSDIERVEAEIAARSGQLADARAELSEAATALEAASAARGEINAVITALADEVRLAELLGADDVDPMTMAPNLLAALRQVVAHASRELVDLGVEGAEDERALVALSSDAGLLPPSLDLTKVLDVLAAAGIPTVPGWSYLARLPAEHRLATFLAAPTLAGGALVQNANDLPRARQLLADAGFAPTSVIGVGSTADLAAAASGSSETPSFVLPANGALYDRDRARDERTERSAAQEQRTARRSTVEARQDSDRALIARLEHLVSVCPPERLTILDEQIARLTMRRAQLTNTVASHQQAITTKSAERSDAIRRRNAAAQRRLELAGELPRAGALAAREEAAADTRAESTGLPDRIAAEVAAEDDARRHDEDARRASEDALRRSLEMAEVGRAYRARLAALPAERIPFDGADQRSLDVVGAAVAAACERYEARTTGSPLARQVETAREERARLGRELGGKDDTVITRARELVATAAGGDPIARAHSLRAASAEVEQLAREDGLAQAEVREAAAELDRYTREDRERHRQLDRHPATREEALGLAEDQRLVAERLNKLVTDDDGRIEAAKRRFADAERRAERLRDITRRIRLPESDEDPAARTWDATTDAASARVDELLRDISDAEKEASRTTHALDDLRARILRWSGDFPSVPAEVTSRFRSENLIDELGPKAGRWREDFVLRGDELSADLEKLEEHRSNVVSRTLGMVTEALGDLDRFSRLSELPQELGDAWAGRRFVEVHVRPSVDRSEPIMRDRITREVDRIVDARAEPRGMDFLWRAVAAVAGENGFAGRILKPTPSYSTERVPIEAMRKWSGGEKVTASILLFVTVAKLRARNRGREMAGAGALMLDNPLGKANYVPFLELQRAVARAAGVQLVFLTAVADMKAVGRFPRVARLRNSPNRGRDYVSVEGYDVGPDEHVDVIDVAHGSRTTDPLPLGP